jgi:hypothetical protein
MELEELDEWIETSEVIGIGKESCKIVSELSKKRKNFPPMREEDFICVKQLTDVKKLQTCLLNKKTIWYVVDGDKKQQNILKEILKVAYPKTEYSLLFSAGRINKDFVSYLTAEGCINHFIEVIENNYGKTLKVLEILLSLIYGFPLIGFGFCFLKEAFSPSPFVKADVINIINGDFSREYAFLYEKIIDPASLLLVISISEDTTLDKAYELAVPIREKFIGSLLKEHPDDEIGLFFFSVLIDDTLNKDNFRVSIFWTEKE